MKTCLLCVYGIKHNMNRRKSVANQENFVAQEDFFFNSFCWCYMKNSLYTVKSGYWVARNILNKENEVIYSELSITKL